MTTRRCGRSVTLSALLALSTPIHMQSAEAAWATTGWTQHIIVGSGTGWFQGGAAPYFRHNGGYPAERGSRIGGARTGSPLQCVPFARENSGVKLVGNAVNWWASAVGIYERGARPEAGSILNFRSISRMRLGHVAVVSRVINARIIEVDHANWASPGSVSRATSVVDVSPQNDWTAVRVALGPSGEFGSVYPTYGFIYNRPDHGLMVANTNTLPMPALSLSSSDLRPANEQALASAGHEPDEEVAEATDDAQPRTRHAAYSRAKPGKPSHGAAMQRVTARAQPAARTTHGRHGSHST